MVSTKIFVFAEISVVLAKIFVGSAKIFLKAKVFAKADIFEKMFAFMTSLLKSLENFFVFAELRYFAETTPKFREKRNICENLPNFCFRENVKIHFRVGKP